MSLVFAAIAPHPPLLLPTVSSEADRSKVSRTIEEMEKLGQELKTENPNNIIISSPHPEWGFDVPLYFLAKDFQGDIKKILLGMEEPSFYFENGQRFYSEKIMKSSNSFGIIASADLSHRLKDGGPYDFHQDGPAFDQDLIESLRGKNIEHILELSTLYPDAGECGLRSICFLLGVLEKHYQETQQSYQVEILSYEGPFGVGYLVANFVV